MKKVGQQAGNRPVRAGRGTGRADGKTSQGGARNSPGQKKGAGLPNLRDIPPSEQASVLEKKLILCCTHYKFDEVVSIESERAKMLKTSTLIEIRDVIQSNPTLIRDNIIKHLMNMIEENLFRPLPRPTQQNFNPEEDEPFLDPEYEHIALVYEIFIFFIESTSFHPNQMKKHIDQTFIIQLMDLFDSFDSRERETLKTVLHRIYGKFLGLRGYIRKTVNNILLSFVYESDAFNGVAELLEILGSIINGFAIPIKAEHKLFLTKVLIPLHKSPRYSSFQGQLAYCIVQFVEKEPYLTHVIIGSILKFWPVTNSTKAVLFLSEIEEILDVCEPHEFLNICEPLFIRLSYCFNSSHFQVAERALYYWNNEYVISLVEENSNTVMPIIFLPLYEAAKTHWNSTIVMLVCNVLKTLMEINQELFDELSVQLMDEDTNEPIDARETIISAMTRAESMTAPAF